MLRQASSTHENGSRPHGPLSPAGTGALYGDSRGTTLLARSRSPDRSRRCNGRARPILLNARLRACSEPSLSVGSSGRIFGLRSVPGFTPPPARSDGVLSATVLVPVDACRAL